LEERDRVLIRIPDDAGEIFRCSLNGVVLSPCATNPLLFEVTAYLKEFNHLEVHLNFTPAETRCDVGGLWKPVLLEIHALTSHSPDE